MKKVLRESSEAQFCGKCTETSIQEQVFSYLADDLEDSAAEEVEDHLLECRHCREFFLAMLNTRGEASMAQSASGGGTGRVSNDGSVPRLADFRKKGT